jgi:hypothetical protein
LRRARTVHRDTLRAEQQLDSLKDRRLVVADENPDFFAIVLTIAGNCPPPVAVLSA